MQFSKALTALLSISALFGFSNAWSQGIAVPGDVMVKATYLSANYSLTSGSGFILASPGGNLYLVTCHSVFSKNSGLDRQWTPDQISSVVVAAVGVSTSNPSHVVLAQPYVPVPDARPSDDNGSERDIALFRVVRSENQPSLSAETNPVAMGDRVYILIKPEDSMTPVLIPATIAWFSSNEIRYLFDDPNVQLVDCFGCPVLSENGGVVAMHLGQFVSKSGRSYGFSTPAASIVEVIRKAEQIDFRSPGAGAAAKPASSRFQNAAPAVAPAQPSPPRPVQPQQAAPAAQTGGAQVHRQVQPESSPWAELGVKPAEQPVKQTRATQPQTAQPAATVPVQRAPAAQPATGTAAKKVATPVSATPAPAQKAAPKTAQAGPAAQSVPVQSPGQPKPAQPKPAAGSATATPSGPRPFASQPETPGDIPSSGNSLDEATPVVDGL